MLSAETPTTAALRFPLQTYPSINPFALDLVEGKGTAATFVTRRDLDSIMPPGLPRGRDGLCRALVETNARWGNQVKGALDAWNGGVTVGIVAGQQAGFCGGPIYTLAKIAAALNLRERFRKRGIDATVFFWVATEDHDLAEVATLQLQTPDGIRTLRADRIAESRQIVGTRVIPDDLRRAFLDASGVTAPDWLTEGITFGESFARLLAELLNGQDVVLVDSLLPELRQAGRELFASIIHELDSVDVDLTTRSSELSAAGYIPQVERSPDGHYSLLFALDKDSVRQPIRRDGEWMVGRRHRTIEGIEELIRDTPERISTGALVRPLLQDLVLQTDVFIGGPAEVAYYAQIGPLHKRFGIRPPHVALRGHVLVAPNRILKICERYGIHPEEIFLPVDEILRRHDPETVQRVTDAAGRARGELESALDTLGREIASVDRGLSKSIERSRRRIVYQFERMTERGIRSALRADHDRAQAITRVSSTLAPGGVPQDRTIGWISLWLEHGDTLMREMTNAAVADSTDAVVIFL